MFSREPYPGLRSFHKDESDIFFGRDDHVAGMVEKLAATHFLCVTGSSGCGKSSLARTGLQNALEAGFLKGEGSDWIFCDFHPGNRPLGDLLDTLAGAIAGRAGIGDGAALAERKASLRRLVADHIERHAHDLNEVLSMVSDAVDRPVLLLVDQFEELFRYALDEPDEAVTFVDVLLAAAAAKKKVYVAITIRTDELDKCSRYPGLTDAVNTGQFLTPTLDRFQIKEAIEGPVMLFGGTVEPALSTWLLNSLEREEDKLPLMQHALKFLYAETAAETPEGERIVLTLAGMHALFGGDSGARSDSRTALRRFLSDRMDRFYQALPERLRRAAPALFCALTDIDSQGHDIRRAVPFKSLQKIVDLGEADLAAIVEVFRAEGYLRPPPGTPLAPGTNIDVTHECVLRTWGRLRNTWLMDEQRSRDHLREFVRDAYSYEADPAGHGAFPALTGHDLLTGERFRRCNDWFTRARPTAAWAERYLESNAYTLPRIPDGKPLATDADSLFAYLVRFFARSRAFAAWRRWRNVGIAAALLIVFAGGTYGYFSYQNQLRLEGLIDAVKVLAARDAISIPTTPTGHMVLGDDDAFARQLGERAAAIDAGVDPVAAAQTGICQGLAPAADPATLVDNPPRAFGCDGFAPNPDFQAEFRSGTPAREQFDAGAIMSNVGQMRDAGRSLIVAALRAEPGVPMGYRYLAWSYGNDTSRPEGTMLAEAGRCLARSIEVSCGDRSGITDLAYGVEALSDVFDQYKLTFQQAILHGQLSHELLAASPQAATLPVSRQVERRRRGAEALAFAAHYLRLSPRCAASASPACAAAADWYDTAATTFLSVLDGIATAPLHDDTSTERAYGAGMFGLFWGEDRAFRTAVRRHASDDQTILILETARAIRSADFASLPRYNSALAMAQCIAGKADEAKATAERIDRTLAKYQHIYDRIQRCGTGDNETLFENDEISK